MTNCNCNARFLLESYSHGSVCVDQYTNDMYNIPHPLLQSIPYILGIISRDVEAHVEVFSLGSGLAMAGLLSAHGVNVQVSHCWEE